MTVRLRNIILLALATALLLLVPLVAMQFTNEVVWTPSDFVFAGVLLFGTGLAYELLANREGNIAYRLAVSLALLASLLLVWVNGAVGIIGSENNPANLLYGGVLATVFIGAAMARLRPLGMARTMLVAALAQLLVPGIALLIWRSGLMPDVVDGLGANALFVVLWIGAGLLFRRANGPPARIETDSIRRSVNRLLS